MASAHDRRWRKGMAAAALVAVTAGVLSSAPAGAAPVTGDSAPALPDLGMPEKVLAEYRREYADVPVATLYQRLALLSVRSRLLRAYGEKHGATFGGSWYDFRTGVWHILATTPGAAEAMAAPARAAGVTVRTRIVRHSMNALMTRAKRIQDGKDPMSRISRAAGVDIPANLVKVEAPPARRTVRDPMVKYVDVSAKPGPDHMCDSRRRCGRPLRTGVILWKTSYSVLPSAPTDSGPRCSLGFVARGTDGSRWALTAGHCINNIPETWGHGDEVIGPISAIHWCADTVDDLNPTIPECVDTTTVDVARIKITNDYWINGGFGYVFGNPEGTTPETLDLHDAVAYRSDIEIGMTACLHAWHNNYTGFSSGANSFVNTDDCGVITDPVSTHNLMPTVGSATSCPGDSGGGWIIYLPGTVRMAAGINKNGTYQPLSPSNPAGCSAGDEVWFTSLDAVNAFFDDYTNIEIRVIHR